MPRKVRRHDEVWIALSSAGHAAPICGFAYTRHALRTAYRERFGHEIERAGYVLTKVRLQPLSEMRSVEDLQAILGGTKC